MTVNITLVHLIFHQHLLYLYLSIYWFCLKINTFQVEALVGFEKSFKHLDDHEVDIGSKVNSNVLSLCTTKKNSKLVIWWSEYDVCVCGIGNYKAKGSEEVQRRRDATSLQHKERKPLCHFWGFVSFFTHWRSEEEDQTSLGLVLLSLSLHRTCNDP